MGAAAPQAPAAQVRTLSALTPELNAQLAAVLIDCVRHGASVGFMNPLSLERALDYWTKVDASLRRGERLLFIAERAERLLGTVQLVFAQPENQPHRADVAKMLVVPAARRRGIGAALLLALETAARGAGRTVLVLDTASAEAARLYERLGWRRCGIVPRYALKPDGGFCDTTFYHRDLETPA